MTIGIIASTIFEQDVESKFKSLVDAIYKINPDKIIINTHLKYDVLIYEHLSQFFNPIIELWNIENLNYQYYPSDSNVKFITYNSISEKYIFDLFMYRNVLLEIESDKLIFIKSNINLPSFDSFIQNCNKQYIIL